MPHITYQDDRVTEYSDGTEVVSFTEAELAAMAADPGFGLISACGHLYPDAFGRFDEICGTCESLGEAEYYAELALKNVNRSYGLHEGGARRRADRAFSLAIQATA